MAVTAEVWEQKWGVQGGSGGSADGSSGKSNGLSGGISWFERIGILQQIAAGMNAMHSVRHGDSKIETGIVHRDLKPGNILRRSDGTIQICDFGLARYVTKPDGAIPTTAGAGAAVGTPQYTAPEQFAGDPITSAVDVYAFGGIIYFMICGQHPWSSLPGYPQISVQIMVQKKCPALPSTVDQKTLPPGLVDLMTRCFTRPKND